MSFPGPIPPEIPPVSAGFRQHPRRGAGFARGGRFFRYPVGLDVLPVAAGGDEAEAGQKQQSGRTSQTGKKLFPSSLHEAKRWPGGYKWKSGVQHLPRDSSRMDFVTDDKPCERIHKGPSAGKIRRNLTDGNVRAQSPLQRGSVSGNTNPASGGV